MSKPQSICSAVKAETIDLITVCLQTYFDACLQEADEEEAVKRLIHVYSSLEVMVEQVRNEELKRRAKLWIGKKDGNLVKTIIFHMALFTIYSKQKSIFSSESSDILRNTTSVLCDTIDDLYEFAERVYKVKKGICRHEGGSGESIEDAIIIKGADSSCEGIQLEYDYIMKLHGKGGIDWDLKIKAFTEDKGRRYDIMIISLKNGESKAIYFDKTEFYGKIGRTSCWLARSLEKAQVQH